MNEHAPKSAPTNGADRGSLRLDDGLRVNQVGEDLLVLDTTGNVVHRVTGDGVEVLRRLADGDLDGPMSLEAAAALDELVEAGIVTDGRHMSRRKVMVTGGVAFAAATVTTFALANPAAAATWCPGNVKPTPPGTFTLPGTFGFTTGPGVTTILARAWGGGGGGGGSDHSFNGGGGGGGGGAYASATVQVTECTTYQVVVGAGGTGGTAAVNGGAPGSGTDGGDSWFGQTLVKAAGGQGGWPGSDHNGPGGAGGTGTASIGTVTNSGGNGGLGADSAKGGGGGGGSAGHGGPGSNGESGESGNADGGAGGAGTPGGATGGTGTYDGPGGTGFGPGGGGGGASGYSSAENYDGFAGGNGAPGAVWVGL